MSSIINMPVKAQLANIGAEVDRAIRFLNANKLDRAQARKEFALKLLEEAKNDPKNAHRKKEFEFLIEEFEDYMNGCKLYDTTAESISKEYNHYI